MEKEAAIQKLKDLEGKNLHDVAREYGVSFRQKGRVNKGWAGLLFEKYLGLAANSVQAPDFGTWELKSIPLKYANNRVLEFKETMAITMINPDEVRRTEFSESHLLAKLKSVVVVARIVGATVEEATCVHSVTAVDLDKELYDELKADYDLVRETLQSNPQKAEECLSSKMGRLIQPRTKGSGSGSRSKAFYAKKPFLERVVPIHPFKVYRQGLLNFPTRKTIKNVALKDIPFQEIGASMRVTTKGNGQ